MNQTRPSGHIPTPVNSLAELQLSAHDLDSILGQVGRLAVETLDGWDAAATSLIERGRVATYGATEERVNPLDQAQYDLNKGPCVSALKEAKTKYFDGTDVQPEWRQFAEAAAEVDVYSVVSFPMMVGDDVLGALNIYSSERDALREGQREEGWLFSSQAAVTIANARAFHAAHDQVGQLKEALETRTMIGQATGMLMTQEGLTSEEAFQKLVKVSQNANIKLREVAARYVSVWEEKAQRQV